VIRKLNETTHNELIDFLSKEPALNLFILGNLENNGYDAEICEFWGDFDADGNFRGVLNRYRDFFVVYGLEGYGANGFARLIEAWETVTDISGGRSVLEQLQSHLTADWSSKEAYFAEVTADTLKGSEHSGLSKRVKRAKAEDAMRIAKILSQIDEFSERDLNTLAERLEQEICEGMTRSYYLEEQGEMVSQVQTAAENSKSAMLVGVCTLPKYRKQGYTTAILSRMLTDLLVEKESVCLFYDNPEAGTIYKRAGFVDLGMWIMMHKDG
jgi:predicted GNAT family acetyltransferase